MIKCPSILGIWANKSPYSSGTNQQSASTLCTDVCAGQVLGHRDMAGSWNKWTVLVLQYGHPSQFPAAQLACQYLPTGARHWKKGSWTQMAKRKVSSCGQHGVSEGLLVWQITIICLKSRWVCHALFNEDGELPIVHKIPDSPKNPQNPDKPFMTIRILSPNLDPTTSGGQQYLKMYRLKRHPHTVCREKDRIKR